MTLKEQLTKAKEDLASLKEGIEAGDSEAVAQAKEFIDSTIPNLEKSIQTANEAQAILDTIGEPVDEGEEKMETTTTYKSLGDFAAKHLTGKAEKGKQFHLSTPDYKASSDSQTIPSSATNFLTDYDKNIVGERQNLVIRSLFGTETISGNALSYLVEDEMEGSPAAVAEGGQKPQIHFKDPEKKTVSLVKVAALWKESDELIEDAAWLKSNIDNRGIYEFNKVLDNAILNGDGTSGNITGLLNITGLQEQTYAAATGLDADDIFKAMTKLRNYNYTPDAILMNPADYELLRLKKDSNGQYYGGGYFQGQYGNGGSAADQNIWGIRTVLSPRIAQGTVVVGEFKTATIASKGFKGITATNSNEDDFEKNLITLRIEERLMLIVRRPKAFVVVKEGVQPSRPESRSGFRLAKQNNKRYSD